MAAQRNTQKSHLNPGDAMRSREIMEGKFIVLRLEETEDAIGGMNHICRWCKGLKFKFETMSSCCGGPIDGKPPTARPKWYLQGFLIKRQKRIEKLERDKPMNYEWHIQKIKELCKGCKVNWCEMYQRCDCEEICNHAKLDKCCMVNWYKMNQGCDCEGKHPLMCKHVKICKCNE